MFSKPPQNTVHFICLINLLIILSWTSLPVQKSHNTVHVLVPSLTNLIIIFSFYFIILKNFPIILVLSFYFSHKLPKLPYALKLHRIPGFPCHHKFPHNTLLDFITDTNLIITVVDFINLTNLHATLFTSSLINSLHATTVFCTSGTTCTNLLHMTLQTALAQLFTTWQLIWKINKKQKCTFSDKQNCYMLVQPILILYMQVNCGPSINDWLKECKQRRLIIYMTRGAKGHGQ